MMEKSMQTNQARTTPVDFIDCLNPATNESLGRVSIDDPAAVAGAVERAREAQQAWAKTSFSRRRAVLQALLDYILDHRDEIVDDAVLDAGKTRESAIVGEIWTVCAKLQWTIKKGEKYLRTERMSSGLFLHKKAFIEYHPRGVVGVICPWNYPFQNIMGPLIPALFAGNAVVVKVSEAVAWSSDRYQKIFDQVLTAHGLSSDLIRIVQGYGGTGAALVKSGVNLIVFTGSVPNGRKIIAGSAETITPVILELGGKDPMIICDDADLEEAVHSALGGVFIACGQNCLAAERIFVQSGIYDAFLSKVTELVKAFRQGAPTGDTPVDVGAIVSSVQVDLIESLVRDAVAKGATVVTGGERVLTDRGQYFAPTILTDLTDEMRITQEETFGPIMCIRKVKDEDEAIRIANSIEFGLASSVFTKERAKGKRIAQQIEACHVRQWVWYYLHGAGFAIRRCQSVGVWSAEWPRRAEGLY